MPIEFLVVEKYLKSILEIFLQGVMQDAWIYWLKKESKNFSKNKKKMDVKKFIGNRKSKCISRTEKISTIFRLSTLNKNSNKWKSN
jgi:hypothetical protein